MAKYESKQGRIMASEGKVFEFWSNFDNIKNVLPPDVISNWESTGDSCSFSFNAPAPINKKMTGGLKIVDKEPCKVVKYGAEGLPIEFNIWIQMKEVAENDTRVKVTLKAKLNAMYKMMLKSKLQQMVDGLADMVCKVAY